ncbi:MAG: M1 family peptidase [Bacteroidetes bacterium]|nr:MAG: M1 family peptidase [Bacteroidota bacterium]
MQEKNIADRKLPAFLFAVLFWLNSYSFVTLNERNDFQQDVSYIIGVELDDKRHILRGSIEFRYTNNSPDTLHVIYVHLWPNAYRSSKTELAKQLYADGDPVMLRMKQDDTGYMDSLDFRSNGESLNWKLLTDTPDICLIRLKKALLPGSFVEISTTMKVKIPNSEISRLGHIGQSYMITQWYPKPAVYDKNGWNYFSYLHRGEFYGEFGDYDVSITIPSNYVVASTGILTDNKKEFEWLEEKALNTARMINFTNDMSFPESSKEMKTLRFKQDKIHDFAWFADKRYHVLKGEVYLRGRDKAISTWSFFTNAEAEYWKKAPQHLADALNFFSDRIGVYPYDQISAADVTVARGSGMEYPMVTAIGTTGDAFEFEKTIVHEVAHSWFYGILGSNEREHPWIDEGFTNFFETRYIYNRHKQDSSKQEEAFLKLGRWGKYFGLDSINHRNAQYLSYLMGARRNLDQAPGLHSTRLSKTNYGRVVYRKSTLCIDYLLAHLGDSLFDACIRNFYEEWKFRHPYPEHIRHSFEKTSNKDLSWFFDDCINSNKKSDYSLTSAEKISGTDNYKLRIKNKGDYNPPLIVQGIKESQIKTRFSTEGFEGEKEIEISCNGCEAFRIDAEERMPENLRSNNLIRTDGVFRKTEKLKISVLPAFERADRTQVFITPVAGWNRYNGLMAGAAIYNTFIPEKKLEYVFAPLYAAETRDLTGGGEIRFNLTTKSGAFSYITLKSGFCRYAYSHYSYSNPLIDFSTNYHLKYSRLENKVTLRIKDEFPAQRREKIINVRHILVDKDLPLNVLTLERQSKVYNFFQMEYLRRNRNPLEASELKWQLTGNQDFYKAAFESNHFFHFNSTKKGFRLRFNASYLDRSVTNDPGLDARLRSSGYSGVDDYLYDGVFFGRSESSGIWSQQFMLAEGGLKFPTFFYRKAEEWMLGISGSTSLPGIIPFRLYGGLSSFNDAKELYPESKAVSF